MELRHFRYFVAVAEEMHFRRAAEKLHMTQPPLSQQIQQLEAELGFELFHRQGRSIVLTEAGAVFLKEVQEIIRAINTAVNKAQRVAEGKIGHLRIGFVESAVHHGLPEIIKAFRKQYPDVDVRLDRLTSNKQLVALEQNQIDIGFCRVQPNDIQVPLRAQIIIKEGMCAVLPSVHPLIGKHSIQLHDLANEDFILFPAHLGVSLYQHIAVACHQAGFTLTITQEATQFTTIVGLVAAGMGISILPESVKAFPHKGVHYVSLSEVDPVPIALVWHQNKQSPVVDHFRHLALDFHH